MEAYRYHLDNFSLNKYITGNVFRLSYVDIQFLKNRDKVALSQ